jgi:signal peptidase I
VAQAPAVNEYHETQRGGFRRRLRSRRAVVVEESMAPTLLPGDKIFAETTDGVPASGLRGAIVVLENPEEEGKWLVKRVLGVPGDRIRETPDSAQLIPAADAAEASSAVEVPEDELYVISDAPKVGRDSRHFGTVDRDSIRGRVWWRYGPLSRRGPVE